MHYSIQTQGIDLTQRLKRQTYEKLGLALDRLEHEIERIIVILIDINGPLLGGVDKACRIEVKMHHQDPLVVEDIDEKVDEVIERATDRLGVVAGQRADLLRRIHKQKMRLLSADRDTEYM